MDQSVTSPENTLPLVNPSQSTFNPSVSSNFVYANFGRRLLAFLLDCILLGFVNGFLSLFTGFIIAFVAKPYITTNDSGPLLTQLMIQLTVYGVQLLINYGYFVYFVGSRGQTIGKMALSIKVVKTDARTVPGYGNALLRETAGKILSTISLGLGYFWMLWDEKKQTWHDKIAGTLVVKT